MAATRSLRQILATTDVHSTLGNAASFLTHLHHLRPTSLVVDCGVVATFLDPSLASAKP